MTPIPRGLTLLCLAALLGACAGGDLPRIARTQFDAGRYEEALAALEQAVRQRPGDAALRADLLLRRERAATALVGTANSEAAAGRLDAAQALHERALRLQPGHPRAQAGLEAVAAERRFIDLLQKARAALAQGQREQAQALARAVLQENPAQREARALMRQLDEQRVRESLAGPTLKARQNKPVTLEFREASLRSAITALSRSSGINFVFDKDVKSDAKTTLFANNVSVEDAIDLLLMTNQLERKVIAENTILIYPGTPQKLRDYQELVIRSFYLENADAKQTLGLVKTMLKTRDVFVDEKLNLLVMRDTPDAIRIAEKLIAAHDLAEPEVMLEVEVVEITHSRLSELGIKWTEQISLGLLDLTGAPFVASDLRGVNSSRVAMNSPIVTLTARASNGDSNILASPRIRVRNREKARIQIGDRVPVISGQSTVATGNVLTSDTITYLDVGLKLDVEPNVHLDDDVAIKIALEVSTLGEKTTTASGSVAYRVGTRNASTVLRLRDGETQVLMGLIRDDERRSANGLPGFSELPLLGRLFGAHQNEKQKTEILLAITPRLVRNLRRVEASVAELWSGTESTLRSAPLYARTLPVAQPAPAAGAPGALPVLPALPAAPVPSTPPSSPPSSPTSSPSSSPSSSSSSSSWPTDAATLAPPAAPPSAAPVAPGDALQLSWRGPGTAKAGELVTLVLDARTGQALSGAAVQVSYDPQALEFVQLAEGSFMQRGGANTAVNHRVDPAAGVLTVRFARLGDGVYGAGELMALSFRARDPGTSALVQAVTVSSVGPGNRMVSSQPGLPHQVDVAR